MQLQQAFLCPSYVYQGEDFSEEGKHRQTHPRFHEFKELKGGMRLCARGDHQIAMCTSNNVTDIVCKKGPTK